MKKHQVNIRLPETITKCVEVEAKIVDVSKNTYYTMALYDYLTTKGLLNVKREN